MMTTVRTGGTKNERSLPLIYFLIENHYHKTYLLSGHNILSFNIAAIGQARTTNQNPNENLYSNPK